MFSKLVLDRMPTGRLGEVDELANLAMYLVSDYANWMTGEVGLSIRGAQFCGQHILTLKFHSSDILYSVNSK